MPHRNRGDSRHQLSRSTGYRGKQRRKDHKTSMREETDAYNQIMQHILTEHPELEALRGTEEGNQMLTALYQERKVAFSLEKLLNQYDSCALECAGMTRVVSTVLTWENTPHSVYVGCITHKPTLQAFAPHWWIVINQVTIDYRARMWLAGLPDVPHGIFRQTDYPVEYEGEEISLRPLTKALFALLTARE